MRRSRFAYFALGVLSVVGMGQVTNQVFPPLSTDPGAFAEPVEPTTGGGGGIVVDGAPVETRADPPCYPEAGDPYADHRYVDCGNGTVLDTVTGLLWLRDANCLEIGDPFPLPGDRSWWDAVAVVATLEEGDCGLTDHSQPGDWRLPSLAEWDATVAQAVALGCTDPGSDNPPALTNDPGTDCFTVGPTSFLNVETNFYWSSTSWEAAPTSAASMNLIFGAAPGQDKDTLDFVWPVRD